MAALLVPSVASRPVPAVVAGLPSGALFAAVVLVAVPGRARGWVAAGFGAGLGLLTVLKLVDLGFFVALAEPFDLLADWNLFGSGYEFVRDALGPIAAVLAVGGAVAVAAAICWSLIWAVRRVSRSCTDDPGHPTALALVLVAALILPVPGLAELSHRSLPTGVAVLAGRVQDVRESWADRSRFADQLADDRFAAAPGSALLPALRGHDVVITFVESYGRSAVEDPRVAGPVPGVLDEGSRRLAAAGYTARSAFLTSPTFGGSSWLAHGSLLAGAWVDSQQRHRQLVSSDRLSLNRAFRRAGWETVGVAPGTTRDWPEGAFFGFDRLYDSRTLGYRGPNFGWASMPDQYTLSAFQRLEHGRPGRPPLMAEIQLVSSHAPWAPVVPLLDWDRVGDGSAFTPDEVDDPQSAILARDPDRVRADYARSVAYSLETLISFVETYGDDDLVLIFLGDHQPNAVVTGEAASHDVPITIVAADPAVLEPIAAWGWSTGLRPSATAPVWRMDTFRDRFLDAYGSSPGKR